MRGFGSKRSSGVIARRALRGGLDRPLTGGLRRNDKPPPNFLGFGGFGSASAACAGTCGTSRFVVFPIQHNQSDAWDTIWFRYISAGSKATKPAADSGPCSQYDEDAKTTEDKTAQAIM